jgi:predicted membrane metal-binding protein
MKPQSIGALFYGLWGLLHLVSSGLALWLSYLDQPPGWAALMADAVPGRWSGADELTLAVVRHHSLNVALFGLVSIVIAIALNRRNSRVGWLANLIVVSIVDLGFVLFIVAPGHVPLGLGLVGPSFWLLGAVFTSIGLRSGSENVR